MTRRDVPPPGTRVPYASGSCAHCGGLWYMKAKDVQQMELQGRRIYCSQSCERTARPRVRAAAVAVLLSIVASAPVLAADCPPPKPLTCAQIESLYERRHCGPPREPVPCAPVPCAPVPCEPVTVTERVEVEVPVPVPSDPIVVFAPQRGGWYAGGGLTYTERLGLTAVAGYRFPRGVMLLAGPTWTPDDDTPDVTVTGVGSVNAPPGWIRNGKASDCRWSYTIRGRDERAWGAQLLAVFPVGGSR